MSANEQQQNGTANIKNFVDNHVQSTTQYKSVDDLLRNGKPLRFVWICVGSLVVIGLIAIFPIGALIGLIFGYAIAYVVGQVKMIKRIASVNKKNSPIGDTDIGEVLNFLSENMPSISSDFHEWVQLENAHFPYENTIACGFGNQKIAAIISFYKGKDEEKLYTIYARKSSTIGYVVNTGAGVSAGHTNAGFGEYQCVYKSLPVLQGAMEYFLQNKQGGQAS